MREYKKDLGQEALTVLISDEINQILRANLYSSCNKRNQFSIFYSVMKMNIIWDYSDRIFRNIIFMTDFGKIVFGIP